MGSELRRRESFEHEMRELGEEITLGGVRLIRRMVKGEFKNVPGIEATIKTEGKTIKRLLRWDATTRRVERVGIDGPEIRPDLWSVVLDRATLKFRASFS